MIIDDRLLRRAKQVAAGRGITLSALVEEALRTALARDQRERAPSFEMVTFGRAGRKERHEPADFSSALAADDAESIGR
jgi:hypothetical protein